MIEVLAGQAMIHDNSLALYPGSHPSAPGTAVCPGPSVENALVHGNLINGNSIVNEAGERFTIANNRS
jgi:hypothetical protein